MIFTRQTWIKILFELNYSLLESNLNNLHYYGSSTKSDICDVKKYFQSITGAQRSLLAQVCTVLQLILVMPATDATSERSFSALRRVKTFLRNTMSQQRMNNLMLLHVHKDITDSLDLKAVANEFVADSEHRLKVFGTFK